mgnify:CR=1 FL=1
MFVLKRTALSALCLSLILPCTAQVLAQETPAADADAAPATRQALPERSQEDATALERTMFVGEVDAASRRIWEINVAAHEYGMSLLKPGASILIPTVARQGAFDKHHLALHAVAHTLGVMVERLDVEFGQWLGAHAGFNGGARI